MKTVTETEFSAHAEQWLHAAVCDREEVVITQDGKPAAKLVPVEHGPFGGYFGCGKGTVTQQGDIVSPIDVEWDADR